MNNRPKMASNGPDGPIFSIFGPFSALAFPFGQKNEKIGSNKAVHHYGAQGAPRVNADVRTENERCGTRQSKGATATAIWI